MSPRPAPDLDVRRGKIMRAARAIAASEGWPAVTMRRVAAEIGVTQPVLYSAFPDGRQALVDAVALDGFVAIAEALEAVEPEPLTRMQAYLDFATAHPHIYEAMFTLPSGLEFGTGSGPEPLRRAFRAIEAAFPGAEAASAEVAWATAHGLASLQISGRLPAERIQQRLRVARDGLSRHRPV